MTLPNNDIIGRTAQLTELIDRASAIDPVRADGAITSADLRFLYDLLAIQTELIGLLASDVMRLQTLAREQAGMVRT